MIAYSIEAALAAYCFDKVIVSTDDQEIADIALQYGAEVPFLRPTEISDDHATTMDVIQHGIAWCEDNYLPAEHLCCIYATAPFIQAGDILKGKQLLETNNIEYAFSATSFPFPIQRAIKINEQEHVAMFNGEYLNTRSQDLEAAYHDAGQFYWGTVSAFKAGKAMFAQHSQAVLLPRKRVQDIDTLEDWEFAEALYAVLKA